MSPSPPQVVGRQGPFRGIKYGLLLLLAFGLLSLLLFADHLYTSFPSAASDSDSDPPGDPDDPRPGCSIPNYDPRDPVTRQFVRVLAPHDCRPQPWVTRAERVLNCSYQRIERVTDEEVAFSAPTAFSGEVRPGAAAAAADFVRVQCFTRTASAKVREGGLVRIRWIDTG